MTIDINTILHTKDGRKIGNGIVIDKDEGGFLVKTDYGHTLWMTETEIRNDFHIAFEGWRTKTHGYTQEQAMKIFSERHKYAVKIPVKQVRIPAVKDVMFDDTSFLYSVI